MSDKVNGILHSKELYLHIRNSYQKIARIWGLDIFQENFKIRWNFLIAYGYILCYISSTIYIVATSLDSIRILKSIFLLALSAQMMFKLTIFVVYNGTLLKLSQRILTITSRSQDQWEKSLFYWIDRFYDLAKFIFVMYISSAILFILYPVYCYYMLDEKAMIVDFIVPFTDTDTITGYTITIIGQLFQVINTTVILYQIDTVFLFFVFFTAAYEELVEHDCESLSQFISSSYSISTEPDNLIQRKIHIFFINAIKRSQEMEIYTNQIKRIFENGCFVQILCAGYTLMLSLVVIKVTDWFVIYLFALADCFQLIIFCSAGTLFESKMENLPSKIYDIPWHKLTISDQKNFIFFLRNSQTDKKLYLLGKNFVLNVATGIQILKSVYSAYIMIENFYKD